MSNQRNAKTNKLETLRLPELQARFREVVGETTRSPNRKFLIRRIEETLAARAERNELASTPRGGRRSAGRQRATAESIPAEAPAPMSASASAEAPVGEDAQVAESVLPPADVSAPATPPTSSDAPPTEQRPRGRFAAMSVEALQAKYLEVVGRPTGSSNVAYMAWKIREAEKGRIPVGPPKARERQGEPSDMQTLPVRLEGPAVEVLDTVWRARHFKSRTAFFRAALQHFLAYLGANEAAALFSRGA